MQHKKFDNKLADGERGAKWWSIIIWIKLSATDFHVGKSSYHRTPSKLELSSLNSCASFFSVETSVFFVLPTNPPSSMFNNGSLSPSSEFSFSRLQFLLIIITRSVITIPITKKQMTTSGAKILQRIGSFNMDGVSSTQRRRALKRRENTQAVHSLYCEPLHWLHVAWHARHTRLVVTLLSVLFVVSVVFVVLYCAEDPLKGKKPTGHTE